MIISKLDVIMADRKVGVNELAELVGIAPTNITKMKTGKIKAVRFSTLNKICTVLKCQPGDIFLFAPDDDAVIEADTDKHFTVGTRMDINQENFFLLD